MMNPDSEQRAEVLRRWNAGEKRSEIARAMNIPLGTVKSRINRAKTAKDECAPLDAESGDR